MNPSARTRIILWRHGLTDWNAQSRFQGQADIELNDIGRAQAVAAAERLGSFRIDAVYSSPLRRALVTAHTFADPRGFDVHRDERLAEINVGTWSGENIDEVGAANPWMAEKLAAGDDFRRSPTGETATEAGARMAQAVTEIASAHPGGTVLVVSHGLVIRMTVAGLLGWDNRTAFGLAGMVNCAWTMLVHRSNGEWKLLTWNQGDASLFF
ncbi:hypothetical protein HMPREF1531_00037 [Propionibacterium sp. oral taxon 192 str. F0372]|uniref:histidine phosphatase family protein n=1 Tax=Propionibacterium sp. oral taxon 192 TaxID=671222 RepID=UPI000352C9EB|nr:histidine phosphatase family protein [Propionibacterium sp. oral taxon 192]EPH06992.1 hypothetical protein HMPREF1531_00037 [Propionibacterium sp. oral taxon 192 str. F0372]